MTTAQKCSITFFLSGIRVPADAIELRQQALSEPRVVSCLHGILHQPGDMRMSIVQCAA